MTPDQKANELIEKFENVTINLPYIDLDNDQAIGEGCMTYLSAVKCAIVALNEIIDIHKRQGNIEVLFWQEVKTELNKKLQ